MRSRAVKEIFCVLALILFVFFLTNDQGISNKSAAEVAEQVVKAMDVSELEERGKSEFKKQFGFNANDFDGVVYYSSDSVMQVRELLIVRLSDAAQAESLTEAIKTRMSEKKALFEGYAPEESALLGNYAIRESGGFVLFAVCDDPDAVISKFKKSL